MAIRSIIHIDEDKCDGCGLCVPACEEGAIRIVNGKAKVVSDIYCDGLGACLGHCPRGAISMVEREAERYDEAAVARHLAARNKAPHATCPGTAPTRLHPAALSDTPSGQPASSQLANWPVQLHLVPPHAPFLQQADLLLVADCVPFACADFHSHVLRGRPVVIGCPKLDDCHRYVAKLAAIVQQAHLRSMTVVHMEVPCCTGLLRLAETAIHQSGISVPLHSIVVTRRGELLPSAKQGPAAMIGGSPAACGTQLPVL